MRMGAQYYDLTSLPQGKTLYPLSRRLDRTHSHPGWVQIIPPTDIQSQYRPAHNHTHLYQYISLKRMFVQNKFARNTANIQRSLAKEKKGKEFSTQNTKFGNIPLSFAT
jgi:hypothetical protein